MPLITQAEFARQQGFSRAYVAKLTKQGTVILEDGKVNVEQAELALAAMRNHNLPLRRKGKAIAEIGKLVDIESVKKEAFTMARKVRDGLLNIPDRISAILATTSNEKEVHEILNKEINLALEELTK